MVLLPKAFAEYMLPIAADQVVKRRRTSVSEGSASSFAFAGTAAAIDSNSAADFLQSFAVVEVSSKESEQRLAGNLVVVPNAVAEHSSSMRLRSSSELLEILVLAMDRLVLLLTQLLPTQLSVPRLRRSPIRFPILLRE